MEAREQSPSFRQHGRSWRLLLLALVIAAGGLAWREQWIELPPNALPWDVPDLTQSPGMFAHLQVGGLVERPERCFAALSDGDVKYTRVQDRITGDRCGYTNAVRLDGLPIPLEHRPTVSCEPPAGCSTASLAPTTTACTPIISTWTSAPIASAAGVLGAPSASRRG